MIENKKLQHTWTFKEFKGMSTVTWELTDMGGKNESHAHPHRSRNIRRRTSTCKEKLEAGWTAIVGTNLPRFVDTQG
ncbi:MAG: hypothetical protein WDO15_24385 [Bacteroidota bacterium]